MVREGPPQPAPYPAEQMRRDRKMRRLPWRSAAFVAVLALVVIVVLVLSFG